MKVQQPLTDFMMIGAISWPCFELVEYQLLFAFD